VAEGGRYELAVYAIETIEDAVQAAKHGIFDFVINGTDCNTCGMAVGPFDFGFIPCAVLVSDTDNNSWPMCIDCILPVITPRGGGDDVVIRLKP
jgi:hypothetical protein